MTEYLKNNPIALRHCLLYEFLRKNSVEKSFHAFGKTVLDNVVEKEDAQFWFKQFEQGIFDIEDDSEPMTDMRDVFRSDKYALRAAVLYESLKFNKHKYQFGWHNSLTDIRTNHSLFIYEKFCKIIGENVMEYREFDFWFYRFLNGEFNLNFDINTKCLRTLNLDSFGPLRHFFHFKEFYVSWEMISVDDARQMKEILLKSPDFERCSLWFDNPIDTFAIKHEFGSSFRENIYHYPIPNTKEYFEIKIDEYSIIILRKKK